MDNPIAFNPLTMTVEQLYDIAKVMRSMLEGLDLPGAEPDQIVFQLRGQRDTWLRTWGAA